MTTPGMGMLNSYNLMGGMYGMGGGMFGGGMYGMGGMMGGGMITSYMFSLNQFLFGIQSLEFSLGQAVQIVGMNAEQMKSLVGSLKEMVENALGNDYILHAVQIVGMNAEQMKSLVGSLKEMVENALGSVRGLDWDGVLDGLVVGENKKGERGWMLGQNDDEDDERGNGYLSEEDIIKKRRLAAFRWTVTLTVSYVAYRTVRRLIRALIFGGDSMMRPQQQYHNRGYMSQQQDGYRYSSQYGNQYGRRGGYYGGAYGSGMGGYGGMSQYDPYGGGGYY
ncbi:hypothetical protein ACHAWO_010428 [Cyclotella atomus]|uniref:Peroxin-13 n=1 Tax=Cyclotella atomus TaxID=382360 RepID=A0ABD3N792_9STRA